MPYKNSKGFKAGQFTGVLGGGGGGGGVGGGEGGWSWFSSEGNLHIWQGCTV